MSAMRVLICSDGADPADKPAKLGGRIARACKAEMSSCSELLSNRKTKSRSAPHWIRKQSC